MNKILAPRSVPPEIRPWVPTQKIKQMKDQQTPQTVRGEPHGPWWSPKGRDLGFLSWCLFTFSISSPTSRHTLSLPPFCLSKLYNQISLISLHFFSIFNHFHTKSFPFTHSSLFLDKHPSLSSTFSSKSSHPLCTFFSLSYFSHFYLISTIFQVLVLTFAFSFVFLEFVIMASTKRQWSPKEVGSSSQAPPRP